MLTGYPSIDRPWLKFYDKEEIKTPLPQCSVYDLIYDRNQVNLNRTALEYYGTSITYGQMFCEIDILAGALENNNVKKGDTFLSIKVECPMKYSIFCHPTRPTDLDQC